MKNLANRSIPIDLFIIISMAVLLFTCEESTSLVYHSKSVLPPTPVDASTVSVENEAGKSVLKYAVPQDENLLYVKAIYETAPGVERQVQSSRFVDTLAIEGFANAGIYPVKLYSVGKNNMESEPVEIMVSPLTPPLTEAFPSLKMMEVFGGVEGSFSNPHKAAIKAVLLADTANTGEPVFLQSYMINNANAAFSFRGLEAKTGKYYVYLMDRWGNKTETKEYELTPLYEERLDKTLWKEHKLESDFKKQYEEFADFYLIRHLFSDYISPWGGYYGFFYPERSKFPNYFTIDLGVTVKLSRLNLVPWWWHIYTSFPRVFEIYGTTSSNPSDNLSSEEWKLIGQFETYKPSGDDPSEVTQDDIDFAWPNGINIDIKPSEDQPDPYFPVRIIRFKIISNWSNSEIGYSIDELTIWGQINESETELK